jgi:hypothetical protein
MGIKYIIHINPEIADGFSKWLDHWHSSIETPFTLNDISLDSEQQGMIPVVLNQLQYTRIKDHVDTVKAMPFPHDGVIDREQLTKDYLSWIGANPQQVYEIGNQEVSWILDIAAKIIEQRYTVKKKDL